MASLTGTKIKDTYDSLLKVSDNGALDGTLQTITDGLGNNSALSLSTAGASVTGTLAVSGATTLSSTLAVSGNATFDTTTLVVDAANNRVGIGTNSPLARLTIATNALQSLPQYIMFNDLDNGSGWTPNQAFGGLKWRTSDGSGIGAHEIAEIRVDNMYGGSSPSGDIIFSTAQYNTVMSEKVRISNIGGIMFNGDNSSANALDDYEEGTFTVAISTNTGSVTMNTDFDTASYVKIGGLVTVGGYVQISSVSSPTGYIQISLPYAPVETPELSGLFPASVVVNNSVSKNANDFAGGVSVGGLRIFIADVTALSSAGANAQQLQAGTAIYFSLTYKTF